MLPPVTFDPRSFEWTASTANFLSIPLLNGIFHTLVAPISNLIIVRFLLEFVLFQASVACIGFLSVELSFIVFGGLFVSFLAITQRSQRRLYPKPDQRPWVVTMFRSNLMLIVVTLITAADHYNFPYGNHKSEGYGYALMDIGVGLFTCANGIVRHRPKGNYFTRLWRTFVGLRQLWFWGLVRLYIVVVGGYYQPLSEYGRHGNFFLIIAIVRMVRQILDIDQRALVAVLGVVMTLHEYAIQCTGLAPWVFNGRRTGLLAINAEFFLCVLGSLPIILFAEIVGDDIKSTPVRDYTARARSYARTASVVALLSVWLSPPSRQLGSPSYGLLQLATMLMSLAILMMADCRRRKGCWSFTIAQIGKHQLYVFMMANFLTGAINTKFDPMHAGWGRTALIMLVYHSILALVEWLAPLWAWGWGKARFLAKQAMMWTAWLVLG
ncbi:pig-W [Carpediemonas membranifera]|uniref:Pig-W n=1 Tax=Carpediemonas membranifera TaxID=201153 RepID=A0A8J6E4T8_9EUKA|nr:pig-W [Carpediemonas membranifera]|eukprot:KAG9394927.1 pig-W [Carpediemonas membranifera]